MTDTTSGEACVKWVLSAGDVVVEVEATLDGNGNIVFNYELVSGIADLNGFYIDINNDGGRITKLAGGNNMNGSDSDGEKLDGFDYAKVIGTTGGNDADTTSGTLTVSLATLKITGLMDLAGAEIGIRATSVGEDRDDSLKLANTGEYCEPEEPGDLCDRPLDGTNVEGKVEMADAQITQLTLTFYNVDYGDGTYGPTPGDTSGDWYYTVTVNVPAEMGEDPDAYLDQIVALLVEQDPFIDPGYALMENDRFYVKSVIVTDCHGDRTNYDLELDQNGEESDLLPSNVFNDFDHVLDENTDFDAHVEATYDLTISGDEFILA